MDRKNSTCLSTYIESNTLWEAVFKKSYRVIAVKILFPDRITEISTRVEILEDNRTVSNCENHPRITDIRRNSQLFICPHGVIGNTIRIMPVRTQTSSETEHFEICEVYVFIQWNQACLRPDLPYMATGVKIINPPKFVYECKEDYELVGDNTVYCQEDGTWTQTSFKCQRRTDCGKLPEVANGVIISNSTTINSTAWLKCNEGFRPLSDHLTYCLPTGMWTSLSFSCELIKCDQSPVIPHGSAELPNGFTYGSKMHITCDQGYMAVEPEFRECHKNGSWGNLNICTPTDDEKKSYFTPGATCSHYTTGQRRGRAQKVNSSLQARTLDS
ncbi:Sushi, von Willebrand factor type A, EGF and pentraxin domain-containing protein 1 [Araneus ventricosus]|uniref:Sushi, von Willebrand factor type A, EGF and pentraxin domain-containing protein 1 n=1 Tax=Araneus ventricosus TaxID=182803 RepID=A0A4Y2GQH1_ARAVE|nr:Sushi, von Willebrand factor type A, EGF and pentraxin domain-containing protein 1 [Araneus ventricosus]